MGLGSHSTNVNCQSGSKSALIRIQPYRTLSPLSPNKLLQSMHAHIERIHVGRTDIPLLQILLVDFVRMSSPRRQK